MHSLQTPSSLTRSQVTLIGWDMDPYVKVSVGDEVQMTQTIRHNRSPVWNKQLVFHVRERDLYVPISISVFDRNSALRDECIGDIKIHISQLVGVTSKDHPAGFFPDRLSTMIEFSDIPLSWTKSKRIYNEIPTLTFR